MALKSQLKQLEAQSSNLQAQIVAVQRQTASLQENNTTLQTQNAKLQVRNMTSLTHSVKEEESRLTDVNCLIIAWIEKSKLYSSVLFCHHRSRCIAAFAPLFCPCLFTLACLHSGPRRLLSCPDLDLYSLFGSDSNPAYGRQDLHRPHSSSSLCLGAVGSDCRLVSRCVCRW